MNHGTIATLIARPLREMSLFEHDQNVAGFVKYKPFLKQQEMKREITLGITKEKRLEELIEIMIFISPNKQLLLALQEKILEKHYKNNKLCFTANMHLNLTLLVL